MSKDLVNIPKATHNGDVSLGELSISSAVLDNGMRVFSERSLATALGIKGGGAYWQKKKQANNDSAVLPEYLSAKYLQPFITNELREKLSSAVLYISKGGQEANGVDATVLADICDVYITAKNSGKVNDEKFLIIAQKAYVMMKAFAKVGIIALVDEATGYQHEREKDELQKILAAYVSDEILKWQKTFDDEFYRQIFRLKKWDFTTSDIKKRPGVVGRYTLQYIYNCLPKGVVDILKVKTPKASTGGYAVRLHQSLTPEVGREHLKSQITGVATLMKASKNWSEFERMFSRVYGGQQELDFSEPIDEPDQLPKTDFDKQLKGLLNVPPPPK